MTQEQAQAKAAELWGQKAFALLVDGQCLVGETEGPIRFYYGVGSSWNEAFSHAHMMSN